MTLDYLLLLLPCRLTDFILKYGRKKSNRGLCRLLTVFQRLTKHTFPREALPCRDEAAYSVEPTKSILLREPVLTDVRYNIRRVPNDGTLSYFIGYLIDITLKSLSCCCMG